MNLQRTTAPLWRLALQGKKTLCPSPLWACEEERRIRSLHSSTSSSSSAFTNSNTPPTSSHSQVDPKKRITEYTSYPQYTHYTHSKLNRSTETAQETSGDGGVPSFQPTEGCASTTSAEPHVHAAPETCNIGGPEHSEYKRIKSCFWRLDTLGKAVNPLSQHNVQWDKGRLEQVIVLCRHGVRLPEHSFPNFTFFPLNQKWWRKFGGQLTPVGVEQMRRIGERLGWYYAPTLQPSIGQSVFDAASDFHQAWEKLTDPFNQSYTSRSSLHEHFRELICPVREKVEVISSGYTRAVFTAQSVMLGLFPDVPLGFFDDADPQDKVYASVRDSHLAVHLLGMDAAFAMGHNQRREYSRLKSRFFSASKELDAWARNPECVMLLDKAFRMTGHKYFAPKNPINMRMEALMLLQQQMEIENALHMPVFANESGLRFSLKEESLLKEITHHMHHLKFKGHNVDDQLEMGRAAGGGTLHIISNCMHNRVKALQKGYEDPNEPAEHKQLVVLSAHDQTLMAVLSYLRIQEWPYPQLGATIMFELRSLPDGEFIVQIKYNDDPGRRLMSSCRPFAPPIAAAGAQGVLNYRDLPIGHVPLQQFNKCFNIAEKWFESSQQLVRLKEGSKPDMGTWPGSKGQTTTQRSEQEILMDMHEAFDYFDKDGSGAINKAELGAMLRMLGRNMTNEQLEHIIRCNDQDGNGLIDFSEFLDVSTQYMLLQFFSESPGHRPRSSA